MKKIAIAVATIVLLGAGCAGDPNSLTQRSYARQQEVQAAYDAFIKVGLGDKPEGVAAYLTSGSVEDYEAGGIAGYFSTVSSADLDWSKAEWSNDHMTVKLFTKTDGIDAGVWSKDASGSWKLTNKFWWE